MKINKDVSFPYPVLGISDDVYPLLTEDCISMPTPEATSTSYTFSIDLKHNNSCIHNLIFTGLAEYICKIDCAKTYYRRCIHSEKSHIEFTIDRKDVSGRVEFNCFVVVKSHLIYANPDFNDDYKGYKFRLDAGDLLVAFPQASYNFSLKYDKLYAAGSFMQIEDGGEQTETTWFNLDGEKINIMLPHRLYEQYIQINNEQNYMEIIHSSIVFNALVYALYNMGNSQYDGRLWKDAILTRIKQEPQLSELIQDIDDVDPKTAYDVAQQLLADPYKRLFDRLELMKTESQSEEE